MMKKQKLLAQFYPKNFRANVNYNVQEFLSQKIAWISIYFLAMTDNSKWTVNHMERVCPLIKEWKVHNLILSGNKRKNLIKDIGQIYFSKLQSICFASNKIQTIQSFSRINFPELTAIELRKLGQKLRQQQNSGIFSLEKGTLAKTLMPFNRQLGANKVDNDGIDIPKMGDMIWTEMKILQIDYTEDREQNSDIRWIFKVQTSPMHIVDMRSTKRITGQERAEKVLYKKYDNSLQIRKVPNQRK